MRAITLATPAVNLLFTQRLYSSLLAMFALTCLIAIMFEERMHKLLISFDYVSSTKKKKET